MSAVVAFFAIIGVANVAFMFAFVALMWVQERAGRRAARDRVAGWDGAR